MKRLRLLAVVALILVVLSVLFYKPITLWAAHRAIGELPPGEFAVAVVCLDYSENRTDCVRVVTVNPATGKVAMIKLYRDLEWCHNNHIYRLNAAWQFGGPDATLRAIRDVSGLDVRHIIVVRVQDAERLVNVLGGLTVDLPSIAWKGWSYHSGLQHLSAADVVKVYRTRHGIAGGDGSDIGRTVLQDRVLAALLARLRSLSPLEMRKVASVLSGVESDLSQRRRLQLGLALRGAHIRQFTIPFVVVGPRLQAPTTSLPLWRDHISAWLATPGDEEAVVTLHDPDVTRPRVVIPHPATEKQKALAAYLARRESAAVVADASAPGITLVEKEEVGR